MRKPSFEFPLDEKPKEIDGWGTCPHWTGTYLWSDPPSTGMVLYTNVFEVLWMNGANTLAYLT